jgi:hypothetical protein
MLTLAFPWPQTDNMTPFIYFFVPPSALACLVGVSTCPPHANHAVQSLQSPLHDTLVKISKYRKSLNPNVFMTLSCCHAQLINAPRNVVVSSWTSSSVTVTFDPPDAAPLRAPLLGYSVTASVGGGAFQATSASALLPVSARSVTISSVGGVALRPYEGTTATEYVVRVGAVSNAGITTRDVTQVRLYQTPSQVRILRFPI